MKQEQYQQQQSPNPQSSSNNPNSKKLQQYTVMLNQLQQQRDEIRMTDPASTALQVVMSQIQQMQQKIEQLKQNEKNENDQQYMNGYNTRTRKMSEEIQKIGQEMENCMFSSVFLFCFVFSQQKLCFF